MKRSELKEMIRRIVKEKKKAIKEARINPIGMGKILSKKYEKPIGELFSAYAEGDSGFNLYEPMWDKVSLNLKKLYISSLSDAITLKELITKYSNKTFVSNNILGNLECPGAPPNSFQERVTIGKDDIQLEIPYIDEQGKYSVGWFDINGKYHPDTKNFNEDGEYIGGVNEARINPIGMGKILPKKYEEPISKLFEYYGEGNSGFDLYEPMFESKNLEDIDYQMGDDNNNEYYNKLLSLMENYPNGTTFVSNGILDAYTNFPCLGAPPNSFQERIIVNKDKITLETPYLGNEMDYSVGWFDFNGKYHPDIKNFDEDGEYIGDSDNA